MHIAVPAESLITRSVVTRNQTGGSNLPAGGPPRERRFITPRNPSETPSLTEDPVTRPEKTKGNHDSAEPTQIDKGKTGRPDLRVLPAKGAQDGNASERRLKTGGSDTATGSPKSSGDASTFERRKHSADSQAPTEGGERSRKNTADGGGQERERQRTDYPKPNQNNSGGGGASVHQQQAPAPRSEPTRQEHREQKQQPQQQQPERKKS
jgi:hypothetical protein